MSVHYTRPQRPYPISDSSISTVRSPHPASNSSAWFGPFFVYFNYSILNYNIKKERKGIKKKKRRSMILSASLVYKNRHWDEEEIITHNSSTQIKIKRTEETKMAAEGEVIACHNVEEWTEKLKTASESKKLVTLDFDFVFMI